RPLLKWTRDQQMAVAIISGIYKGKEIRGTKDGVQMEPADLVNVLSLEDGTEYQMIVGAVLRGNLVEAYPNGGYIGRCFLVTQHKPDGKRYSTFDIVEIEVPSEDIASAVSEAVTHWEHTHE